MKSHYPEFEEHNNPDRMAIEIDYRCRACGSIISGAFSMRYPNPGQAARLIKNRLIDQFLRDFPMDCKEARLFNVCLAVHEA